MKGKKLILTGCLLIVSFGSVSFAQDTIPRKESFREFMKRDSLTKYTLLDLAVNINMMHPGRVTNSHFGGSTNIGINLARFITRDRFHLGIFVTRKQRELFSSSSFSPGFSEFVSGRYDLSSLNHSDSVTASGFVTKVRNEKSIGGYGMHAIGISFHLPLNFFPLIRIYKGNRYELIDVTPGVRELTDDSDWMYMRYKLTGMELQLFIEKRRLQLGVIPVFFGLFVEHYAIGDSDINGVRLDSFLPSDGLQKFNRDFRFGFRFGFSIL